MGTNYYLEAAGCAHCGARGEDQLHLGKSSCGWKFLFQGYRPGTRSTAEVASLLKALGAEKVESAADWRALIDKVVADGGAIWTEDYEEVEPEAFWAWVDGKQGCRAHRGLWDDSGEGIGGWEDEEGYDFTGAIFS